MLIGNIQTVHEGNSLFIHGCFCGDLPPVSATDVTSHLWAKVLRQHLVWDAHNWHLNMVDHKMHKLNRPPPPPTPPAISPTPTLLAPTLPATHFYSTHPTQKKKGKGKGKKSEWLAGNGLSCVSSGAKQELASKRLKAVGLIWGQTECIKRWLLLSVMTTSCAPMFNYFSVMSLPTFHCSTRKTACNSRNTGGGERRQSERKNDIMQLRSSYFWAFSKTINIFSSKHN